MRVRVLGNKSTKSMWVVKIKKKGLIQKNNKKLPTYKYKTPEICAPFVLNKRNIP